MSFKYLGRTFIRILTNWFCCLLIDYAMDNNQLTDMLQVFFECNKNCIQGIRLYPNRFPNTRLSTNNFNLEMLALPFFFFKLRSH
jgi:hypothetical protein